MQHLVTLGFKPGHNSIQAGATDPDKKEWHRSHDTEPDENNKYANVTPNKHIKQQHVGISDK